MSDIIFNSLKTLLGFRSEQAFYYALPGFTYLVVLVLVIIMFRKTSSERVRKVAWAYFALGIIAAVLVVLEEGLVLFFLAGEFFSECGKYNLDENCSGDPWPLWHHPFLHFLQVSSFGLGIATPIMGVALIIWILDRCFFVRSSGPSNPTP